MFNHPQYNWQRWLPQKCKPIERWEYEPGFSPHSLWPYGSYRHICLGDSSYCPNFSTATISVHGLEEPGSGSPGDAQVPGNSLVLNLSARVITVTFLHVPGADAPNMALYLPLLQLPIKIIIFIAEKWILFTFLDFTETLSGEVWCLKTVIVTVSVVLSETSL